MNSATDASESQEATGFAPQLRIASWQGVMIVVGTIAIIQAVAFGLIALCLDDWAKRGQFGDLFGVTNSLFSGLAFGGLVYTIYLQERQIALQSRETHRNDTSTQETLRLSAESVRLAQEQLRLANDKKELDVSVTLLEHYEKELSRLSALDANGLGPGDVDMKQVKLTARIIKLRDVVDAAYTQSLG